MGEMMPLIRLTEMNLRSVLSSDHDVPLVELNVRVRVFVEDRVGTTGGSRTHQLPVVGDELVA